MGDFNDGNMNMSVPVPACSVDTKLAAVCEELLDFQLIDKSTHLREKQIPLLDEVLY